MPGSRSPCLAFRVHMHLSVRACHILIYLSAFGAAVNELSAFQLSHYLAPRTPFFLCVCVYLRVCRDSATPPLWASNLFWPLSEPKAAARIQQSRPQKCAIKQSRSRKSFFINPLPVPVSFHFFNWSQRKKRLQQCDGKHGTKLHCFHCMCELEFVRVCVPPKEGKNYTKLNEISVGALSVRQTCSPTFYSPSFLVFSPIFIFFFAFFFCAIHVWINLFLVGFHLGEKKWRNGKCS